MFAEMPWTTIATRSSESTTRFVVRSATATNGLVSPVAAAAYPPMNVSTRAAASAEATRPMRTSRRVGVYLQKSATLVTRVMLEPAISVTAPAKPTHVKCWSGEWNTRLGSNRGSLVDAYRATITPTNASERGSTTRSSQRITSKPSTARVAWKIATARATGTSGGFPPPIASTTAWIAYAAAIACAANQYVAAITRYGELSRRAPQKPSVARAATWPGSP